MAAAENHGPRNVVIWAYLVVLAIVSVLVSRVLPPPADLVVVITLSIAKAALVLAYFMHMRSENLFIHSLFYIPLALVLILFFGVMPDINHWLY